MKNQNDLIVSIAAGVIGVGFALGFFFTKREPVTPAGPQPVTTTPVALPAPAVAMSNGLGGGSGAAGGGFPGMGGPGGPGGMGRGGFMGAQSGPSAAGASGAGGGFAMGGKGGL